jgi:adenosylmethionine-8-amino-7-oxononanoate aminotransferase
MKNVAHRHGALFITDENMCGFGRTGTMHTWEQEETAVPDIQVMGKGLAAGVQTLSAMLYSQRVHDGITKNGGSFRHGHTFQDHPTAAAAAHETLRIIQKFNLLENVRRQGSLLKKLLQEKVGVHANVGDVRGPALFIGVSIHFDELL